MAYKTGNPALKKDTFSGLRATETEGVMTLGGVANKSMLMLILAFAAGFTGWRWASGITSISPNVVIAILGVVTLVIAGVTVFKKRWSPYTAPLYAVLEGFLLGVISLFYNAQYDGIVLQALLLTSGIFVALLLVYRLKLIEVTQNLRLGIAAATGGIFLFYIANFILGFFGVDLPLINSNSTFGILFTIGVIILAALNLVLDFDFIERGVEQKSPKYMEWYASFGLFVTLVWLYIEVLRLLAKLQSRD